MEDEYLEELLAWAAGHGITDDVKSAKAGKQQRIESCLGSTLKVAQFGSGG